MTAPAARTGATPAKQTNHIFVSSTSIDLQEYRAKVTETVLQLESVPVDMKFFGAAPEWPLAECIARAKSADALIAIVANRYGWRPTLATPGSSSVGPPLSSVSQGPPHAGSRDWTVKSCRAN